MKRKKALLTQHFLKKILIHVFNKTNRCIAQNVGAVVT